MPSVVQTAASSVIKTVVATGASSGLGFETIRQLLEEHEQSYRVIIGARNLQAAKAAYNFEFKTKNDSLTILPLNNSNLRQVQSFAQETIKRLRTEKEPFPIDYLLLNAGISNGSKERHEHGSKWCESVIVNHTSHHYLVHLLREKLVESKSRIVFVSSGAVRLVSADMVPRLEHDCKGGSDVEGKIIYAETKFIALLGAHWWRRQLLGKCDVVAVSPGLIPATGISRGTDLKLDKNHADAKTPEDGAKSMIRAFNESPLPEDPERIFLTSWGEWWPKDVYSLTLDKALQDKWCPSKDRLEKEENLG